MRLEVSTVLLQWATGGLFFCWLTTRRREVGIGYGWTLRITYLVMALGAVVAGRSLEGGSTAALLRDLAAMAVVVAAGGALVLSVLRRRAGVAGERVVRQARVARVEAMTGRPGRCATPRTSPSSHPSSIWLPPPPARSGSWPPPVRPGGPFLLSAARLVVGAAFLGAVTDAMLLGHWYLTQPGLSREPLKELVRWTGALWPVEVALLCWPTGMVQVLSGAVDDGPADSSAGSGLSPPSPPSSWCSWPSPPSRSGGTRP